MQYTISNWFGRLGNNVQQISNAIYHCKTNNLNYSHLPHSLINIKQINFGNNNCESNRFFFFNGNQKDFIVDVNDLNAQRRNICLEYISSNFNFFVKEPFEQDTVVIHIRSGDIFSKNPSNTYVQNPLDFYLKIIDKFDFAIVVAEDRSNPIIKQLELNPKVLVQCSNIENDFSTLLRAKCLVSSGVGTFCVAAALCSKNITDFYCSDIHLEEHLNYKMLLDTNIRIHLNRIQNYIKIGDWKNTLEQQKLMLEYKL